MIQILNEVKESLMKKKIFSLLILILGFLFFAIISFLFLQLISVETKTKSFYAHYNGKNIYQLSDSLFDEKEEEFFSKPEKLNNVKNFYNYLNKSTDFVYLNTTLQPIGVQSFQGNETFLDGYEYGSTQEPYERKYKEEKYWLVKSIQLNENIFKVSNLKLQMGSFFKKNEYIYKKSKKIPVILGSQYEGIYKVGDTLKIDYIDKDFVGEVIGILEPESVVPAREETEFYLDRYIILPELIMNQLPSDSFDLTFQQRHYLQLIGGQILTKKDNLQIRKFMHAISNKCGFEDYTVIGANGIGLELMVSMMQQSLNLIIGLVGVLFVFCILSISFAFNLKWNVNIRKYSIHLISGATLNKIFIYMFTEVGFILILSIVPVLLIMQTIGVMPWYYYLLIVCTGVIISILGLSPLYLKLKKLNISELLKGKE
ncbi:ABC transporter permease [Bacillus halotolerans]|uniref:ABC transporter permease n=1 Tax=Bacillus halotolerans TaxID=260554 RepID=UPI00273B2E28|nr:ABC transporter permease [Bacillus halotolerans]MDP4524556.1 ABC transporter permease [Bacillus halotolerans]